MTKRYIAQLRGRNEDQWEDSAYFDDPDCAAQFVRVAVKSHKQVVDGRVVDAHREQRRQELTQ